MAQPINLVMTEAGLDALVNAQGGNTEAIEVTEIGLTETAFDPAPTVTVLPGEFKRLASVAGQSVAPDIIHMVALDATPDVYQLRGVGLYLADGTLFAIYGQDDPIFDKVTIADFLFAFDVRFSGDIADAIVFGDASFLYPPATETVKGVAELATQPETDAGDDDSRIVTPLKLASRLLPILQQIADETEARAAADAAEAIARGQADTDEAAARLAADNAEAAARAAGDTNEATQRTNADAALQALIDALRAITITGGGVASGGGNLTANRQITVTAASAADLIAATDAAKVATPAAFGALPRQGGPAAYEVLPGGSLLQRGQVRAGYSSQQAVSITFPVAFADTNYDLQLTAVIPGAGDYDNFTQEVANTRTATGVTIYIQDPSSGASSNLSGFNWRAEGRYA